MSNVALIELNDFYICVCIYNTAKRTPTISLFIIFNLVKQPNLVCHMYGMKKLHQSSGTASFINKNCFLNNIIFII